jgi:hypothetical protein
LTIKRAAPALCVAQSTIHRLITSGIIAGEQTPGMPRKKGRSSANGKGTRVLGLIANRLLGLTLNV